MKTSVVKNHTTIPDWKTKRKEFKYDPLFAQLNDLKKGDALQIDEVNPKEIGKITGSLRSRKYLDDGQLKSRRINEKSYLLWIDYSHLKGIDAAMKDVSNVSSSIRLKNKINH